MNARQRRTTVRARMLALSSVVKPGHTVRRIGKGKAQATSATIQSVTPQGFHVVRADKRSVFWPFGELCERVRFRMVGKGHAPRLSASIG